MRKFYNILESDDTKLDNKNLTNEEYCSNVSDTFTHNIRSVSRIMSNYVKKWVNKFKINL